ncbi:hypothetical protein DFJ74DRAFT_765390 [Hyaloraphidium curvatum]|nr:hypothetical protein DFJ74DRAFT_765390 [Hyaloraphidium curvatum]
MMSSAIDRLRAALPSLALYLHPAPEYADSTAVYNLRTRPAAMPLAVAWPTSASQLADLARVCGELGLGRPGIRSGGTDVSSSCLRSQVMADLSPGLRGFDIVAAEGKAVARFGGGCRLVDLQDRARHDVPGGPHVAAVATWPALGAGSIVNACGYGNLSRTYGLAVENLVAAEVVMQDGSALRTSPTERPDLWARLVRPPWDEPEGGMLCAAELEMRLHPLGEAYCGQVAFSVPAADLERLLAMWGDAFPVSSPREINTALRLYHTAEGTPAALFTFLAAPAPQGVPDNLAAARAAIDAFLAAANARFPRVRGTPWDARPGMRQAAEFEQTAWRLPGVLPVGIRQEVRIEYVPMEIDASEGARRQLWDKVAGAFRGMPGCARPLSVIYVNLAAIPGCTTPPFAGAAYEIIYNVRWRDEGDDEQAMAWIAGLQ